MGAELGIKTLRFESADGSVEIWNSRSTEDNKPKLVPRKIGGLSRRFSKEGQVGSPKYVGKGKKGKAQFFPSWDDTDPEAERMKLKYLELDVDGDGMLDISELAMLLKKGKSDMPNVHVKLLFDKVDVEKSGKVSFDDFVDFVFKARQNLA